MYGVCFIVQLRLCQSFSAHMPIHFSDSTLSLRFLTKHIASSSSNISLVEIKIFEFSIFFQCKLTFVYFLTLFAMFSTLAS
jgi:hypothetical protein